MSKLPAIDTIKGRVLNELLSGVRARAHIRIAAAVEDGETVTIGDDVYEFDTDDDYTSGNIQVDCTGGSEVAAQGTLTITSGQNAVADETVTIGTTVYTWKAAPSAAYEVDIGADDDESCANLAAAINAGTGEGTVYGTDTEAHPSVTAEASTNTVVVTAITPGTAGNSIATTETMTQGAFDAATLGTTTAGVDPTAGEATDALLAAIEASGDGTYDVVDLATGDLLLTGFVAQVKTTACSETMGGAGNVIDAAFYGGVETGADAVRGFAIVPTANEVAAGLICLPLEDTPTGAIVQVRVTSTGAALAWDGKVTIDSTNNLLKIDNTGSTDWAVTNTLSVLVF